MIASSAVCAPPSAPKDEDWASLKLIWNKAEAPSSEIGIPIGNSHIGAKIKGDAETAIFELNNKTFWSGWPVNANQPRRRDAMLATRAALAAGDYDGAEVAAKGMWGNAPSANYLPLGNLLMEFTYGAPATEFVSELNLDRATSAVQYKVGDVLYKREAFASFPDRVIVVRLTASKPGQFTLTTRLENPPNMGEHSSVDVEQGNSLVMRGKAPSSDLKTWDAQKGMKHETRVRVMPQGGQMTSGDKPGSLHIVGADSVIFHVADQTSYNGYNKEPGTQGVDPAPLVQADLERVANRNYDHIFAAHLADYQPLFRRLWLQIDQEDARKHVLNYQFMRYEMIAVSRTGDLPHNLVGMWSTKWEAYSRGQFFLNENVQKYYAIVETGNIAETTAPLWNWMDHVAANGAETARVDWGFRGWMVSHCSDIWAATPLKGSNNEWAIWPTGGIWLCQNLWDHYAFGQDKAFLRDRAYPIMKGAAEFALDYLVEDKDGHLVTSPSTSPENRFSLEDGGKAYAVTIGSTIDIACIRELFENLIEAESVLHIDPEFSAKLKTALSRLKPYQISRRESSKGELQEWANDHSRLPQDPRRKYTPQRHSSHLVAVWPLRQISEKTPELFAAARLALDNRGKGGYHPDKAAMYARLKDGDNALRYIGGMGHRLGGIFPPLYSSLAEMIVQSHSGEIELLPALPSEWKQGKLSGIRARGNYELSMEWQNGELVECRITSLSGNTPLVRYKGTLLDLNSDPRVKLIKPKAEAMR